MSQNGYFFTPIPSLGPHSSSPAMGRRVLFSREMVPQAAARGPGPHNIESEPQGKHNTDTDLSRCDSHTTPHAWPWIQHTFNEHLCTTDPKPRQPLPCRSGSHVIYKTGGFKGSICDVQGAASARGKEALSPTPASDENQVWPVCHPLHSRERAYR